jgi:prepilin-type processing-associated H-X9-DG protein
LKTTRPSTGLVEWRAGSCYLGQDTGGRDGPITGFHTETEIDHPYETPVFGDGIVTGAFVDRYCSSPPNLADKKWGNGKFAIPRHGSRPSGSFPDENISPEQKLPGAINMSFYDGHVEQVPLERLWILPWHKNYVPLAKRPGW